MKEIDISLLIYCICNGHSILYDICMTFPNVSAVLVFVKEMRAR